MAKQKLDGVVEAVHYTPEGRIEWVRAYVRRGVVFSDHVLIPRQELIAQLKEGKRFLVGQRKQYLGGIFEASHPLRLEAHNGQEVLLAGEGPAGQDRLEGVPII